MKLVVCNHKCFLVASVLEYNLKNNPKGPNANHRLIVDDNTTYEYILKLVANWKTIKNQILDKISLQKKR